MLEALGYPFFQRALLAGLLVSLLGGALSAFVVQRRLSFLGDGLAHAAFADLLQDPVVADLLADHRTVPGVAQKGRLRLGYRKPEGGS